MGNRVFVLGDHLHFAALIPLAIAAETAMPSGDHCHTTGGPPKPLELYSCRAACRSASFLNMPGTPSAHIYFPAW